MRKISRLAKKIFTLFIVIILCINIAPGIFAIRDLPEETKAVISAQSEEIVPVETFAAEDTLPAYLNTSLSYKERAADLVSRMSLHEKELQLIPAAPAIPRLGLRAYAYQNEALHGLMSNDGGSSFPSPITTASSWNPELMLEVGKIVSDEIRAFYNYGNNRGLSYYSPTMNLMRDPRWGRNEESYSEDPYITAVFGEAFVRGMQGIGDGVTNKNPGAEFGRDYVKVIPTLKHYAANSSERNRNSGTYDIDNKTLRDYYTWAFQRIIEKTNVSSLMSAYNRINGFPCSASDYLLTTLLRKTFGFTGFVVNDCGAVNDTILNHKWIPPGWTTPVTIEEAVALHIKAGDNMDCGGGSMDQVYDDYTASAVSKGLLSEDEVDHTLIEILVQRFKTGEFDGAITYSQTTGYPTIARAAYNDLVWSTPVANNYTTDKIPESKGHIAKTIEAGMQGAVLLKNTNNALPIKDTDTSIRVFGPLARCWDLGDYSSWPKSERVNFRQGMQLVGTQKGKTVEYWEGSSFTAPSSTSNMVQVRAIGFYPGAGIRDASSGTDTYNLSKSGTNLTNVQEGSYIRFPNIDLKLMSAEELRVFSASSNTYDVNAEFHLDSPNGSILGTVLCLRTGSNSYSGTLATAFVPITSSNRTSIAAGYSSKFSSVSGQEGSLFDIDKFNRPLWDFARGENNGIHDIYVTFSYERVPTLNETQLANASHSGISVVYIGTATANARNESDSATFGAYRVCNEASDRPNLKFPAGQEVLVNEVAARTKAAGGRTVVMIQAVGVMDVSAFVDNVDAIVWTAYNGMRQGEADAKVLFGDYNPGGHLTQTWYANDQQLYSYPGTAPSEGFLWDYSIDNRDGKAGRTYMYYNGAPRYPFGYGLSYSSFKFDNMAISGPTDGVITVTANVTNTGTVDGADVVQVYVKAPGAGNGLIPKQQLMGFARVEVPAGQTKAATIKIELKDLMIIDPATIGTIGYSFNHGTRILPAGNYEFVVAYDSTSPVDSKTVQLAGNEIPINLKAVTLRTERPVAMKGNVFASDVSVCLTDETFIKSGTQGLSIVYSSSNPAAATVDPATGVVTAINGGTSLITATVSYNGKVMTADYPVAVLDMASLTDAKINGQTVTGFRYNRFQYDIALPPCTTYEIPVVTYAVSEGCSAVYTQTDKLPGKSTIVVTRGIEIVTYEFNFTYESVDVGDVFVETLATFNSLAAKGPRSTYQGPGGSNQMYFDWTNIDPVPTNSNRQSINLMDFPNQEGLYLTFTMEFSAEDESVPISTVLAGGSPNCVRLRDSNSSQERNFGWRPTSLWGLRWGKNYVKIPLASAIKRADTGSSDRTVPTSEYTINVNGSERQATECHLNTLNWADVTRMIFYVNTADSWFSANGANNKITFGLSDIKIIDATVQMQTADLHVALEKLMTPKIAPAGYTKVSYDAYLDAYEKAGKINAIADWPSPLLCSIQSLQTAIEGLVPGYEPVTVQFYYNYTGSPSTRPASFTKVTNSDGKLVSFPVEQTLPQYGSRADYGFNGWYTTASGDGEKVTLNTVFTEDTSLYARWEQVPSLWREFDGYFLMGGFVDFSSTNTQMTKHYNINCPSNSFKLDSQIGSSNTASTSRSAYSTRITQINAMQVSDAEKAALKQLANEDVRLATTRSVTTMLNNIRTWNNSNPTNKKYTRFHTVMWHGGQQPKYFFTNGFTYSSDATSNSLSLTNPTADGAWASRETMKARIDNYIKALVEAYLPYKDIIVSWDIINEPIDDFTGQVRNITDSASQRGDWGKIWHDQFPALNQDGTRKWTTTANSMNVIEDQNRLYDESEYIRWAFEAAAKWFEYYDTDWSCWLNDYMDSNKPYTKLQPTLDVLKWVGDDIDMRGHKITYGFQGRLAWGYPTIEMLRKQAKDALEVADLIAVSENDVRSDFEPNPFYDPTKPTVPVTASSTPQWNYNDLNSGSGSYSNPSASTLTNTFDAHNGPARRMPEWNTGSGMISVTVNRTNGNFKIISNGELFSISEQIMKNQADFAADWLDILVENASRVELFQWDGTTDSSTFNTSKGAHMWVSNVTGRTGTFEKYSFFAVIGSPARDKLKTAINAFPQAYWTANEKLYEESQALLKKRIYTLEGVNDVKAMTMSLTALLATLDNAYITYDANGATGAPVTESNAYGAEVVAKAPAAVGISKAGYALAGWNTSANGIGKTYAPGEKIDTSVSVRLYAQWEKAPATYTVKFESYNHGYTGSTLVNPLIADQIVAVGGTAVKPVTPKKNGYAFVGWYRNLALTNEWDFAAPVTEDMRLFAKWEVADGVFFYYKGVDAKEILPGETISVNGRFDFAGNAEQVMFVALYNAGGYLVKLESVPGTVSGDKILFKAEFAIPSTAAAGSSIKAFIWDADTYIPLQAATQFPE